MHPLLLLILLGFITYFIVQRVSNVTRTPTWLLWFVAMLPAFIWSGWAVANAGRKVNPPASLVIAPLIVCLVLYWFLIQWGRIAPSQDSNAELGDEDTEPDVSLPPSPRPIDKSEERDLHTCFPWSIYYLQDVEYRPQAVICR